MTNEIQVGSAPLSGTETLIATLAAWHPYVDVYVDGTPELHARGSIWNLYAVTAGTRTRIGSGNFDTPTPLEGQRVMSAIPGEGTTIALYAFTPNGATGGPVTAAIVGWDPSTATVNPDDASDATVSLIPGPETVVAALVWHPEVSIFVQAGPQALGSLWKIRAVIPGLTSNVQVGGGLFEDVQASRVVGRAGGGASSWLLTASAPKGPTGIVNASIFGKTEFETTMGGGVANVTATLPLTSSGGPNPNIAIQFPISDGLFSLRAVADATKTFRYDLSGQLAGTLTTFFTTGQANRAFRTPDIDGTAVVQQDATGFVFLSVPPVIAALHGSAARVQLSSLVASGAQFRGNQYGANAGVPGLSTFKSRGATIGSLAGVLPGDVIGGITSVGVAPDNVSIPLGALFQFVVPLAFVPAAQNWVPTDMEVQLVPLAGPINGRRRVLKTTSEGITQTLRGLRAGGPSTISTALETGALWSSGTGSPEGVILGTIGDLWSRTDGGPGTALYVKETGIATNTGWFEASAATAAWRVPAWFIDPVAGDNAADGTTAITPIRTYAELVRRWGTVAPLLYQDTTITFLSDQPDLLDPVMLLGGNAAAATTGVIITGDLTPQGPASTFTAVTVRNRATDTRWTFTDASKAEGWAAAFIGYLVHDTTADAWFWIEASLPGRVAQISEPLASAVGNPVPAYVPIVNGDGYQIYAPRKVNVVRFAPSSASGSAAELRHLWLFNAGGEFDSEGNVLLTECRAQPFYTAASGVNLANCYLFGLNTPTGYIAGGVISTILTMPAGGGELLIDGDCLVDAPALGALGTIVVGAARFAAALDVPELNNAGAGQAALYVSNGGLYGTAAFWGPSTIDGHVGGDVGWVGGTAVATFLNLGGLTLDGAGVASSYNLATGLWAPGIALTPANLDAATPGGFGGVAYGVKGSKIRSIS